MPRPVILQTNILNSRKGARNILINKAVFLRAANIVKGGCRPRHSTSCEWEGDRGEAGEVEGSKGSGGIAVLLDQV